MQGTEENPIPFKLSPMQDEDTTPRVVPHPDDSDVLKQALLTDPTSASDWEGRVAAQRLAKDALTAQTIAEMPEDSFKTEEEKFAAASKIAELMTGQKDYDGRLWNGGKGFKTGAEYLRSVKETLSRGTQAAMDPDLQAWMRMTDAEKDAKLDAERGFLSKAGEAAGDIGARLGELVRGVPRLSKEEYANAPEDVREASDAMGSVMWEDVPEDERKGYEEKVRDWRGSDWQRLKRRSEYEAKLRRKNALVHLPDMIRSLETDEAKDLAGELSQNPAEIPANWTARLKQLPTRDIETLSQIRGMTREHVEGGFFNWLGDAAIGVYNGAHGLISGMGEQEAKAAALAMGWDPARINEMIQRKHALWNAYAGWSAPAAPISDEHGAVANFTIGLASAVPFIASMHLKGIGFTACATEMISEADAKAAAEGIDVTNPAYCAQSALMGGLYAYMLKAVSPKFFGATANGAAEDIALRTAFMKGVLSGCAKLDTAKVMSQRTASGAFMMAMQQGISAINEDLNLGGDAWRDASQRFTETFVSSIPDMLAFSAHGVLEGHARASGGWRRMFGAEGRANRSQNLREAVENAFAVRTAVNGQLGIEERRMATLMAQIGAMRSAWTSGGEKALARLGLKPEEIAEAKDYFEAERRALGAAEKLRDLEEATDAESLEEIDEDAPLAERNAAADRYRAERERLDAAMDSIAERLLGKMKDEAGTVRDLASVRNVWAQGHAVGAGAGDGVDVGAAALEKAGFSHGDAAALSAAFGAERKGMYSPAAAEALRDLYTRSTRGQVEATAALAAAFGGRVRTAGGRTYLDFPMPEGGTGTLAVETADLSEQFYGRGGDSMGPQVETITGGRVTAEDWRKMDDAARREVVKRHRLIVEGDFDVIDPADPSLRVSASDAERIVGRITLDPSADPGAGFHETMHGFLRFCQETGFWDEADLKWLQDTYGAGTGTKNRLVGPDGKVTVAPEQLNEESAAEGFRGYLAKRMAGAITEEPSAWRKMFALVQRMRHLRERNAAVERIASNAEEALYDQLLAGRYAHIRDLKFTEPSSAAGAATEGKPTEAPQTGAKPAEGELERRVGVGEESGRVGVGEKSGRFSNSNSKLQLKTPTPTPTNPVSFEALTPTGGRKVKGHYEIVPLGALLHSNKAGYPMELQQRDRKENKGEEATRNDHVNNFEAGYLLDDPKTDSGAMVVARRPGADGKPQLVVVSGNGRTMVLEELANRNLYDRYRNRMKEWAAENGVENAVADADNPVLVRVLDDLGGASLKEIADLSNTNAIQQMNEEETARADADLVRSLDLARLYVPNLDGSPNMASGASDAFFREFVRATGDTSLLNSDGTFTEALRMRARRALLAIACGQGPRGRETVKKLVEDTQGLERQKEIAAAIAPHVAAAEMRPEYAVGPDVSRAFADYVEFRENREAGAKWASLDEYLKQGDMLDPRSEIAESIMRLLDDPKGAPVLAETARLYSEAAKGEADGLFGAARTRAEIWRDAAKAVDEKAAQERARSEGAFAPETRFSIRAEGDAEKKDEEKKKAAGSLGSHAEGSSGTRPVVSGGATSHTLTRQSAEPVEKFGDSISQNGVKSPAEFLTGLVHALGSTETNPDRTQYFDITHEDGRNLSLRVANHRATAAKYKEHGNTADVKTSIVVKMSDKLFQSDRDVELTEHVYFSDRLTAEREAGIAHAVAGWIATGEWNGPAADQVNMSPRRRYSIGGIYTGTAADYANRSRVGGKDDGPSLKKIGTGEGSQVYGWGLYGSTVRGVAEKYARIQSGDLIGLRRNGERIKKPDSKTPQGYAEIKLASTRGDVESAIKELEKERDLYRKVAAKGNAFGELAKQCKEAAEYIRKHGKEYETIATGNLYEQTFFTDRAPGDESHLLKWYEPVTSEQLGWVRNAAEKEGVLDDRFKNFLDVAEKRINGEVGDKANGESLYLHAKWALGSPQAASEFLARAGIDGVKYPVDSYGGKGVKDGDEAGWNYVAFSDEHIRVDHKWTDGQQRFSVAVTPEVRRDTTVDATDMTREKANAALRALAGRDLKNDETGIVAQVNSVQRRKILSGVAVQKSIDNGFSAEEHNAAASIIEKLWKHASLGKSDSDKNGDPFVKSIKRFVAPVRIGGKDAYAYLTVKESNKRGHRIYSIELEKLEALARKLGAISPAAQNASDVPEGTPRIVSNPAEEIKGGRHKDNPSLVPDSATGGNGGFEILSTYNGEGSTARIIPQTGAPAQGGRFRRFSFAQANDPYSSVPDRLSDSLSRLALLDKDMKADIAALRKVAERNIKAGADETPSEQEARSLRERINRANAKARERKKLAEQDPAFAERYREEERYYREEAKELREQLKELEKQGIGEDRDEVDWYTNGDLLEILDSIESGEASTSVHWDPYAIGQGEAGPFAEALKNLAESGNFNGKDLERLNRLAKKINEAYRAIEADIEDPRGPFGESLRYSIAQTATPQFKRWFGDWEKDPENASKVVDKDGKPLIVYRRDNEAFTVFDFTKTQQNDAGWLGKGFYFYGNKREAESATGYGKNLRAFYLNIRNPYHITSEEYNRLVEADDPKVSREFTERLKSEGYDGVYWNGDLRQEWAAFEPTQIKSATDNTGAFSPTNPDIRYSIVSLGDRKVAVLDRKDEIAKIDLNDRKSLHDYLVGKVGQELMDGFFVGEDLPNEYIYSEDAKGNNKRKRKAKAKLATSLDEAAQSSAAPTAEDAEHKRREGGKYYRRAFAFAVPSGLDGAFRAYTADLVSYMKDGTERLYDVVNIEDAPGISADLAQLPSRIAQEGTSRIPAESGATSVPEGTARIVSNPADEIKRDPEAFARRSIAARMEGEDERESALVAFVAERALRHGPKPNAIKTIGRIGLELGLKSVDTGRIIEKGEALAERVRGTVIEKAVKNGDVATAVALLARESDIDRAVDGVVAGAAEWGGKLTEAGKGRIKSILEREIEKTVRSFNAASLADVERDTGIDIADEILHNSPEKFDPSSARRATEGKPEGAGAEGEEGSASGGTSAGEENLSDFEIARRQRVRKEAEERVAKMIATAKGRTEKAKLEREERERRRRFAEEAAGRDAEHEAEMGEGGDGGGPVSGEADPGPKLSTWADFKSPEEFAAFFRVWAEDRYKKEHGASTLGKHEEKRLFPEFYRKAAVRELQDLADKLLPPKGARATVNRWLGEIQPGVTPDTLERISADVFAFINRNAIRESRSKLVRTFRTALKPFAKGKNFDDLKQDTDRKVSGWVEEAARYIMRVCELSDRAINGKPSALEEERARLQAILDRREKVYDDEGKNAADAPRFDMETRRALAKLQLLDKYGAMRRYMPGEIEDLADESMRWLNDEAGRLDAAWREARETEDQIRGALTAGIVGPNGQRYRKGDGAGAWFEGLFDSLNGMIRLRLQHLVRFADSTRQQKAKDAINRVVVMLGDGEVAFARHLQDDRAAFHKALATIFAAPGGRGVDRRALADWLNRMTEAIPRELSAKLSKQGYADSMTYGQMLQLLVSLEQRSYAEAIKANGRDGQAALIRTFETVGPDGRRERVLTDRDILFIDWLRSFYEAKRGLLSSVTRRMVGLDIDSPDPLYCPVKMYMGDKARGMHTDSTAAWDPIGAVFSRRVANLRDFDESASILGQFFDRSAAAANLVAWGERGSIIRGVFTSASVQESIRRAFGGGELTKILKQLEETFNGGESIRKAPGEIAAADKAMNWMTYLSLGYNPLSAAKQTTSFTVWANALPGGFRDLWRYMTDVDMATIRHIRESEAFRVRYGNEVGSGHDVASKGLFENPSENPVAAFFRKTSMGLLRKGDFLPGGWIAQGLFRDLYNRHLKEGMDADAADRLAMTETFNMLEETQQSGRTYNTAALAREHGRLGRLLVQFATSPLQQLQYETQAAREVRDLLRYRPPTPDADYERRLAGAKGKLVRAAVINHVLLPAALHAVTNLYRVAMGYEPEWEKDGWHWSLLRDVVMGQFSRIFFLGAISSVTTDVLITGKPVRDVPALIPAEGIVKLFGNIVVTARDVATLDYERVQKDLDRLMKSTSVTRTPYDIARRISGNSDADRKRRKEGR